MKNKLLLSAMFLLVLVGLYSPASFSQPTAQVTITNDILVGNVWSFDVYIKTLTGEVDLYTMQFGFTYNIPAKGAGTLTAAWSNIDPAIVAAGNKGNPPNCATAGVIKCSSALPTGGLVSGTFPPMSSTGLGTHYGTLSVTNSVPWVGAPVFTLCFTTTPYPSKLQVVYNAAVLDISAGSTWSQTGSGVGVLPVELGALTSAAAGRSVVLNWSTKTEKNSDRFEVERSLVSNSVWSTVGVVKASVLSNSVKNYTYTDNKLQSGKYQYRLKMVDNNGSFSYSPVTETEVALPKDFAVSQNYPNPFNPSTKIDYQVPMDSKVIMEVYNIAGQRVKELVNQNQTAGYYTIDFGATKLSSGVYIYRISAQENATGKNFSSIKKMMLLK